MDETTSDNTVAYIYIQAIVRHNTKCPSQYIFPFDIPLHLLIATYTSPQIL